MSQVYLQDYQLALESKLVRKRTDWDSELSVHCINPDSNFCVEFSDVYSLIYNFSGLVNNSPIRV